MFKVISVMFLTLLINGCQINPTTGDSNVHIISNEKAVQQALVAYSSIITPYNNSGHLDSNKAETEQLNRVVQKLLPQAQKVSGDANNWNWEFHVIADKTVNAWCMAGGKIAVYSGLFDKLDPTDDELAFVLAHEMGHALGGHVAAKQSMQILTNIGLLAYNSQHKNDPQLQQKVQNLSTLLISLPYSRAEETQADKIGVDLMTRAGYNPEAGVTIWQKMINVGGSQVPEFQSDHPSHENRIATIKEAIKTSNPNSSQETLNLVAADFDRFKGGEVNLDCNLACSFSSGTNRKSMTELYSNQNWKDLAIVITKLNFPRDVNYFYLGRAAEELGYRQAAKIYYQKAIELSTSSKRCGYVFKYQCNGIDVPSEADAGLSRVSN